jgi:hypothetical protein
MLSCFYLEKASMTAGYAIIQGLKRLTNPISHPIEPSVDYNLIASCMSIAFPYYLVMGIEEPSE